MAGNPIQQMLDARGFPWRAPQAALTERYGVGRDPWFDRAAVVLVENEPPLLPGLLRPLHFEPSQRDDPSMPPLQLRGWAWASRGRWWRSRAMNSLAMVLEPLEPVLGRPQPDETSNTRGWRWRFGPASIELMCFPPRLALPSTGNEIPDRRDPRVDESCWVKLFTGYRRTCTPSELADIDGFAPAMTLTEGGDPSWILGTPPKQDVLEYVREPCSGFEKSIGRIGRSANGENLIFGSDQLYLVPAAQIEHVHVDRIVPARGIGHSAMSLVCRGNFGDRPQRRVFMAFHQHWDGLNDLARRVAEWLERPCLLGDYEPDE